MKFKACCLFDIDVCLSYQLSLDCSLSIINCALTQQREQEEEEEEKLYRQAITHSEERGEKQSYEKILEKKT